MTKHVKYASFLRQLEGTDGSLTREKYREYRGQVDFDPRVWLERLVLERRGRLERMAMIAEGVTPEIATL